MLRLPRSVAYIFLGHVVDAFKDWRVRFFWGKAYVASLQKPLLRSISVVSSISELTPRWLLFPPFSLQSLRPSDTASLRPCYLHIVRSYHSAADALAQLLTVPPYAVTFVVITFLSWSSDRLLTRGPFIIVMSAIGGIGYMYVQFDTCGHLMLIDYIVGSVLLTTAHNNHVQYFATFCIVSGTYTTIGLVIAWCKRLIARSRSLSSDTCM